MATLNQRLKLILPIVLALLLPLLSILVNDIPMDGKNFTRKWAFPSLLILIMWYVNLIFRQWRFPKKRWKNIAIVLSLLCVFSTVYYFYGNDNQQSFGALFIRISFIGIILFIIQQVIWTQEKVTALRLEKEQLQSENLKVQLKELRNQMDPHFFFNSLNTLRSMVRQNHKNAEQFIMGLSDLYRQMLKYNENTTLPLSEEIAVLKSYLFLMKNRNEKALDVNLEEIDEIYNHHKVPTLALQSVVENCFKHNSMSSKQPLKIKIRTINDAYVEVINNLQPRLSPPETSGLGLDLLKKRYQLLKVEKGVIIASQEDVFSVKLKLIPPP